MPINMPSHGHGQGYTDLNFLIPELIDGVEFRKGLYHAAVGDFSSAGSAHLSIFKVLPQSMLKVGIGQSSYRKGLVADSIDSASNSRKSYCDGVRRLRLFRFHISFAVIRIPGRC